MISEPRAQVESAGYDIVADVAASKAISAAVTRKHPSSCPIRFIIFRDGRRRARMSSIPRGKSQPSKRGLSAAAVLELAISSL